MLCSPAFAVPSSLVATVSLLHSLEAVPVVGGLAETLARLGLERAWRAHGLTASLNLQPAPVSAWRPLSESRSSS